MTARYTRGILAVAGLCTAASFLHAQTATPLQIVTDSLPPASVGAPYNQQLITTGGVCSSIGSASSTIDSGALPPGLSIALARVHRAVVPSGHSLRGRQLHFHRPPDLDSRPRQPLRPQQRLPWMMRSRLSAWPCRCQPLPSPSIVSRSPPRITPSTFLPRRTPVQVTSTGGAAVAITVQSVTDSGGPWLSVTAQSSTTPAALSISYSVSGLAPGTYTGRVTVTTGGLAALTIPVTLQVVTDNIQLQSTPSPLAFTTVAGALDPPGQSLRITVAGANKIFQATVSPPRRTANGSPSPPPPPPRRRRSPSRSPPRISPRPCIAALTVAVGGIPNSSLTIPVTFTITALVPVQKPTIAAGGVVNAAGLQQLVARWLTTETASTGSRPSPPQVTTTTAACSPDRS